MTELSPRDAIAVRLAAVTDSTTPVKFAEDALAALAAAGYSVVPTAEVEPFDDDPEVRRG